MSNFISGQSWTWSLIPNLKFKSWMYIIFLTVASLFSALIGVSNFNSKMHYVIERKSNAWEKWQKDWKKSRNSFQNCMTKFCLLRPDVAKSLPCGCLSLAFLNWDSQQGRDLATSGCNKNKFQLDQSYSYIMRKVWYHQIWIQNNLGFMVSDLLYSPE